MATSIIKLHTFSGAGDGGPPCFLLQVDDFYCLLDCGWSEDLPSSRIAELAKWVKKIDAVLISHQSLRHLGLLPHLVGKYGLKCPIYSTTPVYKLGQLFCYDAYQSRFLCEDFSAFTLDDVDDAFQLFVQVKYHQTINLQGKGRGLSVTPLPSGHMLGGTIWKLVKDETDIIYAIDFNNEKSRHLNGAAFDACIRPKLLLIDVSNALYTHVGRKDRNEALRQLLLRTLRRGGNVLISVDTAGYCLEIANLLESLWHSPDSGFMAYGLAMLSHVAFNVFDFTKSLVEWMSEKILRTFEDQRCNPFHLRHLQLCHTLDQLDCVSNPKVILSTDAGLRTGFARLLFADWADSELNTVVITSRDGDFREVRDFSEFTRQQPSLGRRLIGLTSGEEWARQGLATAPGNTLLIPFTLSQRVPIVEDVAPSKLETSRRPSNAEPDSVQLEINPKGDRFRQFTKDQDYHDVEDDDDDDDEEEDDADERRISIEASNGDAVMTPAASAATPGAVSAKAPYVPYEFVMMSGSGGGAGTAGTTLTHGRHMAGYDIFPGLHNHSGGHFFRTAKRTQLVFPTTEKSLQWDEYGEKIDTSIYRMSAEIIDPEYIKKRGRSVNRSASRAAIQDQTKVENKSRFDLFSASSEQLLNLLVMQNSSGAPITPGFQMPQNVTTKCVVEKLEIPLRCEISFIDYESRSDGRALKKIITGLRPQEVILLGSTRSAIDAMVEHCRSDLQLKDEAIHTPSGLDVVNCTKEGDIYQARMKDSLVTGLKFTKIREYELAWVEADIVDADESSTDDPMEGVDGESHAKVASDALPVLVPASGPVADHATVFVNEPKLSDMKQILLNQGLSAEFVSGVLVVDNCVAIKRTETGRLVLEGMLSPTYYNVRAVLYRQFAIL
uniref:Cleavage and polyadenylation specificity factor subunit 2 n=1 Tax=Mesocestoides corti TaxID=53468 RepID=A0A5K3EU55_MESCO